MVSYIYHNKGILQENKLQCNFKKTKTHANHSLLVSTSTFNIQCANKAMLLVDNNNNTSAALF